MTVDQVEQQGWRKGVTLRDVATDSGVSVTTVSRILNGREGGIPIRDETRTRVLEAAARLGYTPNLLARGLRGSRSSLLGVIARDISDPFHLQVLRGVNESARNREYRLFLGHVDYRPEVAIAYGSMFERSHADGIIVIGDLEGGDPALDILARQHRYVVGVTDRTGRRQVPGVYGDSVAGSQLAMEHLWSLGHRSIICVSDARTHDGRRRIEVYRQFMADHGISEHAAVHITDQEPGPAYDLGRRLFADGAAASATAIYATSDTTALGLMKAAFEAGIAVPDRLSIVGYDDIDLAAYTIPPLTTVSQSGTEMGRLAGELLFDIIARQASREEVDDVVLAPTLVARQSTAPSTGRDDRA
jgi:LacI family transcriptional regulator, repressor for deo operon, udp, cdd, tsx, nupC, and nupG